MTKTATPASWLWTQRCKVQAGNLSALAPVPLPLMAVAGGNIQVNCNQSKICLQGANNLSVTDPTQSLQMSGKAVSVPWLQLLEVC